MSRPQTLLTVLSQRIDQAVVAGRGMMATVTQSDGAGHVRVSVARETGDRGQWYPSVGATIPVGTVGVLLPLTGSNALFLPVGLATGGVGPPVVPTPAFRDGSSVGTYTDSAGTGVVINSLGVTASGLDSAKTYLAFAWTAMRLGASSGTPLQQAGVRMGNDAGAVTTRGTGHSAGTGYEWAFGAAVRTFTGLSSFQVNGVAYANVTTAQNIAGGELHAIVWPQA